MTASGGNLSGTSAGSMMKEKIPKGFRKASLSNYTPQAMNLYEGLFPHLGKDSFLSKLAGGDQSAFEEMEAPAMRQFQGLLGQNASRFSGMGLGARRGSGFQNQTNQITSDFAQDLQSRRTQMRMQAIQELMGLSNQLLGQKPYENYLVEKQQKQPSGWSGILGGVAGGVGGYFMGGPGGALKGAQFGHEITQGLF